MYFVNINKLKEDIKNGALSEKDRFLYMFFCLFLVLGIYKYSPENTSSGVLIVFS